MMNLSLKRRIMISYLVAVGMVLFLTIVVYYFFSSWYDQIRYVAGEESQQSQQVLLMRVNVLSLVKQERHIRDEAQSTEAIEKMLKSLEVLSGVLETLKVKHQEPLIIDLIGQMMQQSQSIEIYLRKGVFAARDTNETQLDAKEAMSFQLDQLLSTTTELLTEFSNRNENYEILIKRILPDTKRNMMITLIIGFFASILLSLVMPGKISLPFKKIRDAIRELQNCNFDVSIYYNQNDEIGEISKEMNQMIHSFKTFEELRADRILVEGRKFDALANMVRRPVLVANADGRLTYLNNRMYSLLQVQSEEVLQKFMTDTCIPEPVIHCYELAIKRRSKIENEEITIYKRHLHHVEDHHHGHTQIEKPHGEIEELPLFQGFANVIPIRGKESTLDYYLMVLSTEVFT